MSQPPRPEPQPYPPERSATVQETEEEIRQALLSRRVCPGNEYQVGTQDAGVTGRAASPYRPTVRPPVPILTVFDDGRSDGEVIRIRQPKFIIGRTDGDLRFPLDGRMSSRHVEVTIQFVGGRHRWVVTDLRSTHGLFIRVSRTALADGTELLVGGGRYRFEAARASRNESIDLTRGDGASERTQGLDEGTETFRPPTLTELIGTEIGTRGLLSKPEYWIGTDPSCQFPRPDDPFCDPRHARLYRGPRGQWYAEHNRTRNGLWVRMTQVVADSMVYFQAGEQRFKLKVP